MKTKTLILVRHAKSSWDEPGICDRDRPLNDRGKKDVPRIGKFLSDKGVRPGLIVSSPARRAKKTAEGIAKELGFKKSEVRIDDRVYTFDEDALLRVIWGFDDGLDEIMVVGHNPAVTALLNRLTRAGIDNVPTCGAAVIEISSESWAGADDGAGRLVSFDYPKNLP